MADVSKLVGYAVTSAGYYDRMTVTKLAAYAVINDADSYVSVSKLMAYAVIEEAGSTPRGAHPQVFSCT